MSTSARPYSGPGSVYLIDANNFLYRAYHALPPLSAPDGTPVNAVHGFVRMVQAIRKELTPETIVAVFDSPGPSFRAKLYPEYKANRPPPPDDLVPQFELVRKATDALGIPRIEAPEIEADDLIASYALAAQRSGKSVVIVSSDKDLMQLVGKKSDGGAAIEIYDTMKNKVVDPQAVVDKWGVGPALLGDLLALTGDSSDNIPGIKGIGPKTAAELLKEYKDLEGVLAAAPGIKQKKRREMLIEHAADARLSRKLVELRGDLELPRPLEEMKDKGTDPDVMTAFFAPLGFRSLVGAAAVAKAVAQVTARSGGETVGAHELQPASTPLKLDPATFKAILADDEAHLVETLAALAKCEAVVVQVAVDHSDAMLANLVGVALAGVGDEAPAPIYVPLRHQGDGILAKQLAEARAKELLRPLLAAAEPAKICHASKFQAIVLGRHGLEVGGVTMDPQLASYTVDPARPSHTLAALAADLVGYAVEPPEKVLGKGKKAVTFDHVPIEHATRYAGERAAVAGALGTHLKGEIERSGEAVKRLFEELEMPLAGVLRRIEERGILVDPKVLKAQSDDLAKEIDKLKAEIDKHAGYALNPDSPTQLQKLLFEDLGLPATRKTKTGYSTDAAVLEELSLYHPVVSQILEYRSLTKLKGTYLDTLPLAINPHTGRLHTSFRQAVAQTGRLSSKDPNLQNIPIRTELGRRIREAFVAGEGKVLVTLDYSQIELRVLAHLSGDKNLSSAFRDGVDVHRRTASEVFEVPEAEVTSEQRRVAKAVNFGVIYGQTAFGLARQLGIPRGKAGAYIKAYLAKLPGVTQYMDALIEIAKRHGYAETILGRKRRIPELQSRGAARSYGERIARNTPIQGSAADILKKAMIDVDAALASEGFAQMLLTVHDELIFECEEARIDDLVAIVRPRMEGAVSLSVPLVVEMGQGKSWADCKG
ncbi:MAG: DNA polymerase I [Myxococcales bacterium]|nr:DNA polymerase I [Myxococcales bacterium]